MNPEMKLGTDAPGPDSGMGRLIHRCTERRARTESASSTEQGLRRDPANACIGDALAVDQLLAARELEDSQHEHPRAAVAPLQLGFRTGLTPRDMTEHVALQPFQ